MNNHDKKCTFNLYIIEHFVVQGIISRLKGKSSSDKNEARACVASAQRISDRSEEILKKLTETRVKLNQLTKQKETTEKSLRNEITRLKLENDKLMDRLRNKSGKTLQTMINIYLKKIVHEQRLDEH